MSFPHAFSGSGRVTSRVNNIVSRHSPLVARQRLEAIVGAKLVPQVGGAEAYYANVGINLERRQTARLASIELLSS
jgi:hypothetical protein